MSEITDFLFSENYERASSNRKAGELLKDTIEHGGDRKSKLPEVTLKDINISKRDSSNWQRIADIPEESNSNLAVLCDCSDRYVRMLKKEMKTPGVS